MTRRSSARMVIGGAITAIVAPAWAAGESVSISLTGVQIGTLPQGFAIERTGEGASADWKIVEDDTTADSRALAQTSVDRMDYRFCWRSISLCLPQNVEVSLGSRPSPADIDRAGGSAVRLADRTTTTSSGPTRLRTTSISIG